MGIGVARQNRFTKLLDTPTYEKTFILGKETELLQLV